MYLCIRPHVYIHVCDNVGIFYACSMSKRIDGNSLARRQRRAEAADTQTIGQVVAPATVIIGTTRQTTTAADNEADRAT